MLLLLVFNFKNIVYIKSVFLIFYLLLYYITTISIFLMKHIYRKCIYSLFFVSKLLHLFIAQLKVIIKFRSFIRINKFLNIT